MRAILSSLEAEWRRYRVLGDRAIQQTRDHELARIDSAGGNSIAVIAGHIVLKSGDMARRLNATLPGVSVPEELIKELDAATEKPAKAIEIGGRLVSQLKGACRGVHIMAIGWEARIPAILQAGGVDRTAA